MLNRLAIVAQLHPRKILTAAVLLVVAGGIAASTVFNVLKPFGFEDPASESIKARESLEQAAEVEPGPGLAVLVRPGTSLQSPQARRQLERVAATLQKEPMVTEVQLPYGRRGAAQVSRDGDSAYVLGFFKAGVEDKEKQDVAQRLEPKLERQDALLGGLAAGYQQVNEQVEKDLQRAEMIAFPILFLISFIVFRSLVAASLPLLVGGISIVTAILGLRIGAEFTDLSIFAVNLITGVGLGLSIDYSLFVVSRYREELAKSGPGFEALQTTMKTAGRTVVFSSLTVAAALASLIVFPQRFLYSMGLGGSLVALFAGLVSITVLPAMLALLGDRVNALAPKSLQRARERAARPDDNGFWYRLSHFVMRRPIPIATIAAVALLAAGTPFLGVKFTFADAGVLPTTASARQFDDILDRDYRTNQNTPVQLEVRTGDAASAEVNRKLTAYSERLQGLNGVLSVAPPTEAGPGVQRVDVFIKPHPYSDRGQDRVQKIRDVNPPFPTRAGGTGAEFLDEKASLLDYIPIAAAILIATTLFLVFLLTGSVILPIKTLIMNLLSVTVAFGVLVFVFQDGRLENLLDYESQGALDTSMPLLLFATVFGLSTDYGIFLLTRIKEARDGGADDTEAVAIGLERTGRIVTAAAILLSIAIGALATSQIIFIKEYGIGAAVAVLVDAAIVRAFLVPSLMKLLGKWNWWAPKPLRRLHERFGISEAHPSSA